MTNESKIILLKCKLYSMNQGLKTAVDKHSSKEVIKKWKTKCIDIQDKIIELTNE